MVKVTKFGGTSVAKGESFEKVKDIVLSDENRKVVVVSAPGKRFKDDTKITDLLYVLQAHIKFNTKYNDIKEDIKGRYVSIKEYCKLSIDVASELDAFFSSLNKYTSVDYIVSRGEYFCAKLMAEYLGYPFVDSADWLFFDYEGKVDYPKTNEKINAIYNSLGKFVTTGFYGVMPDGSVHTFSRGGGDITGAIAAAGIKADAYENWTDVSGIMMADPKIVPNPRPIEKITYSELRELSYMGAEVLHEETIFPLRSDNIPLYIKNTNNKDSRGTLIMEHFEEKEEPTSHFITGITGKKGYTIITIFKSRLNEAMGYMRKVFGVSESLGIYIEHVSMGVDNFSLIISADSMRDRLHTLIGKIENECEPDNITISQSISLIAIVGRRMVSSAGISGKIFTVLGESGINVRLIEQGAGEINITVGVEDKDYTKTITLLYNSFA